MTKTAAKKKVGGRVSNSDDFISEMPDAILLVILTLMPLKDAVATGTLSKRWKYLWCNLTHLNFDDAEVFDKMAKNPMLCDSERLKYINWVKSVIQSYDGPTVKEFRIRFGLDCSHKRAIDSWLKFAVNKKVEMLELDFIERHQIRIPCFRYDFPFRLSTADYTIVEPRYFKKVVLKGVNVRPAILQEFLINYPHLETLCIHDSASMTHVVVGREALKLKHLEIAYCSQVRVIKLSDCGLVSFSYKGPAMDLRLADLPKIKELDISQGAGGFERNIFCQIKSCVSYIEVLSLTMLRPMQILILMFRNSIPELPNVKKLRLTVGAYNCDTLLDFTSIADACPRLENFTIELLWCSPIRMRRELMHVDTPARRPYNHLRLFEVLGYYGRISEVELVTYIISNSVALKQIVIDPRCQGRIRNATIKNKKKKEETARSLAHGQLKSVMPQGVKLVILSDSPLNS